MQRIQLSKGWVHALEGIFCALVKAECFGRLGEERLVESTLNSLDKEFLSNSPFCKVAKTLVEARISRYAPGNMLSALSQSLTFTENMGTLYQQCEILNELSRFSFDMNEKANAAQFAKRSLNLARRNRYRLLGARALLLAGRASDIQAQKQRCLLNAFQEASEMGLRELMAESAYEIGEFQLAQKKWVKA